MYNSAKREESRRNGREGKGSDATPMPRGAVICPFYERPDRKSDPAAGCPAELFHRKRRIALFYDNVKTKVYPRLDETLIIDCKNFRRRIVTRYGSINHRYRLDIVPN